MKKNLAAFLLLFLCTAIHAQIDSSAFTHVMNTIKNFKPDTSAVPQDRLTRKIVELRSLRGNFNIDEVMRYKLEEEAGKNPNDAQKAYLKEQFTNGAAHQWLSNATIWIYRRQFTYREIKKLVKFYRTSAGQKLSSTQPLLILETLASAEMIQQALLNAQKK